MLWRELFYFRLLIKRLGIVLLMYSICRLLFYLFNKTYFPAVSVTEFAEIFIAGIRFDLPALVYVNILVILMHLIPNPWRDGVSYQRLLKGVFFVFNGIALGAEATDFIYFRFGLKRSSSHTLSLAGDAAGLMPQFIRDFWYLGVIVLAILILMWWLYGKTYRGVSKQTIASANSARPAYTLVSYLLQTIVLALALGIALVSARGGLQLKPINPGTAGLYVNDNRLNPVVINTTFSILYSLNHRALNELTYLPEEDLSNYFQLQQDGRMHTDRVAFGDGKEQNVLVLVLESFSNEYIGALNPSSQLPFTPFLDSLMGEGLSFTNAYANGKHSNEGIGSIIAGIPVLMEDPFIASIYNNNRFLALPSLLQREGYSTHFFHGGKQWDHEFRPVCFGSGFRCLLWA